MPVPMPVSTLRREGEGDRSSDICRVSIRPDDSRHFVNVTTHPSHGASNNSVAGFVLSLCSWQRMYRFQPDYIKVLCDHDRTPIPWSIQQLSCWLRAVALFMAAHVPSLPTSGHGCSHIAALQAGLQIYLCLDTRVLG